jgi:hypothetical protein
VVREILVSLREHESDGVIARESTQEYVREQMRENEREIVQK